MRQPASAGPFGVFPHGVWHLPSARLDSLEIGLRPIELLAVLLIQLGFKRLGFLSRPGVRDDLAIWNRDVDVSGVPVSGVGRTPDSPRQRSFCVVHLGDLVSHELPAAFNDFRWWHWALQSWDAGPDEVNSEAANATINLCRHLSRDAFQLLD